MRVTCLFVAAMGIVILSTTSGFTQECGDVDGSGGIVATDALLLLNKAVGQPVPDLTCPLTVGVLKTGQTQCFSSSPLWDYIDCAGTGQDGELQKGVARSFTDRGDGTIADNATGLMWEKLSDDDTIHDTDNLYSWTDAFAAKVALLNSTAFAGYTDWRVPNVFELFSLVDNTGLSPHFNEVFDSACVPGCDVLTCSCATHAVEGGNVAAYWSSTSFNFAFGSPLALFVDFFGSIVDGEARTSALQVRAVRGGS
jgi:hypothetical protein